jgi:hypothetical protein
VRSGCDNDAVADSDLRVFIRDITRRNELVWREVMAELRAMRQEHREFAAELRDMRRESIAQREGLFKLIDEINRLTGGEGPATA